jgi:hypothetical protein
MSHSRRPIAYEVRREVETLIAEGWTAAQAAKRYGVKPGTARQWKWRERQRWGTS